MSALASVDLQPATARGVPGAGSRGREEDLYAKWRDIFDQAPPSLTHDRSHQATDSPDDLRDEFAAKCADERTARTLVAGERESRGRHSVRATDSRHPDSEMQTLLASQPTISPGVEGAATHLNAPTMAATRSMSMSAAAAKPSPLQPPMSTPQRRAPSAEAVSVFVTATTVVVVVRNAALGEQDALDCAFDTARELTGSSAGLQQLTVNGRVLYRQPGAASAFTAPGAVLRFAC